MILRYRRLSHSEAVLLRDSDCLLFHLGLAVDLAAGIFFSALVHAWDCGVHVQADIPWLSAKRSATSNAPSFSRCRGTLFSVTEDPSTATIDLKDAFIIDHSAVAAIQDIPRRSKKRVLITISWSSTLRWL